MEIKLEINIFNEKDEKIMLYPNVKSWKFFGSVNWLSYVICLNIIFALLWLATLNISGPRQRYVFIKMWKQSLLKNCHHLYLQLCLWPIYCAVFSKSRHFKGHAWLVFHLSSLSAMTEDLTDITLFASKEWDMPLQFQMLER